ncbi:DNA-binding transcriptional LysR family regulator [Pantoea sp. PNA 14-12]|uniref:LysR family transcriptional regulator n=1 Tax=Pantoea TaxID=53335 RepID=UPI0005102C9F|nr:MULTISPECIES: LysR family transcriptional regulator [Pantoea]KGD83168.1 LysR family transcriptional regulator [Pantoea stewartii subsp. indologenes]MEB6535381.1 LysR family transcriptional regulator [Pantoea stewartii]NRH24350.1 LysR family transcriptional regulator [Pantoea stewartii]PXV76576.1 DNA-binding transcriptional LysR family regulator [Pantoea sp. PNA 03-3]QIE98405.1 LysR family transcriptional regulator [Pantoea stewartii]
MNWDDVRFFLALARHKTLRGASKSLNVDQATVGRRIAAFESALGSRLFIRTPRAFTLSEFGEQVMAEASAMESAMQVMRRKAACGDNLPAGNVRIATTDTLASAFVMPAIERLREDYPDITVTLLTGLEFADISYRSADIAIRGARPDSEELIVKRLATIQMGLYVSQRYFDRLGEPNEDSGLTDHQLVMFPAELVPRHRQNLCGFAVNSQQVVLECNTQLLMEAAIKRGIGIGLLSTFLAERDPQLIPLFPDKRDPVDIWLVLHPDLQKVARIRAVITALEQCFAA